MNYIYLLAGILTFNLLRLNGAWSKTDFTWAQFAKDNVISMIVAILLGSAIISSKSIADEFINIAFAGMDLSINLYIILGIGFDTFVKKIYEIVNPKKQTGIGLNK